MFYRQCILQKNHTWQTAYIPEEFAKNGKILRIKEDNGWVVKNVGTRLNEEQVIERSRDYLHQREGSDI